MFTRVFAQINIDVANDFRIRGQTYVYIDLESVLLSGHRISCVQKRPEVKGQGSGFGARRQRH